MFAFLHFITFVKLKKTLHNSFVSENIFFYIRPILLIFFKSKQDYEGKNSIFWCLSLQRLVKVVYSFITQLKWLTVNVLANVKNPLIFLRNTRLVRVTFLLWEWHQIDWETVWCMKRWIMDVVRFLSWWCWKKCQPKLKVKNFFETLENCWNREMLNDIRESISIRKQEMEIYTMREHSATTFASAQLLVNTII